MFFNPEIKKWSDNTIDEEKTSAKHTLLKIRRPTKVGLLPQMDLQC